MWEPDPTHPKHSAVAFGLGRQTHRDTACSHKDMRGRVPEGYERSEKTKVCRTL